MGSRTEVFTYLGILDDEVERYPFGIVVDENYAHASLLNSVLFSGPLLLNDGYLLQNKLCRDALLAGAEHPLRLLIDQNFVGIVSIGEDIEESLIKRAESGVTTIKQALESNDGPELRRTIREIGRQANENRRLFHWPKKDTGDGFKKTIERARYRSSDQIGHRTLNVDVRKRIFDEFENKMQISTAAARTQWRNISTEIISQNVISGNQREALREAMNLANEAYHYNFAACLAPQFRDGIAVETQQSDTFDELLEVPDVEFGRLKPLGQFTPPKINVRTQSNLLREFLYTSYELGRLKRRFLAEQEMYIEGLLDIGTLESTRNEYARKIAERSGSTIDVKGMEISLGWLIFGADVAYDFLGDPFKGRCGRGGSLSASRRTRDCTTYT